MTLMKSFGSAAGLALAALAAGTMLSCKTDCVAGTGCGGPVTYDISIKTAPANLGALILSIQTEDQTTVTVVSGRALPGQLSGTGMRRAIIIGPAASGPIANVLFSSLPAHSPVVSVIDAAAGQTGAYASIATAAIQLGVTER
jgi:hypothetical protein